MTDELPGFEKPHDYMIATPTGRRYLMTGYGNADLAVDAVMRREQQQVARSEVTVERVGR